MGTSRQRLTKDVGATGLVETWGYIKDDFLKEWTGQQKIKSIDEMLRNSSAVGANRYLMEQMLRGVTWYINSEEGDDDPRVELLNDALNNMTHSFDDHIVDVVLMPFYGFSVFTITYEFVGGRTYWRKFKMLGHDTIQQWLIAEDGGIEGLQQWPHLWPAPIPIERMLLYRFRKPLNNPEGESILRPAWTSWYYVKNLQNIEAISLIFRRTCPVGQYLDNCAGQWIYCGFTNGGVAKLVYRAGLSSRRSRVQSPSLPLW